MPNFTKCGANFVGNTTAIALYGWKGLVHGIPKNESSQISYRGCVELCGGGAQYYDWQTASGTMLNWVLPVIGGVLLQAPFESNAFWKTIFTIARWIGSPVASLSYSFWAIRVSGHAALMTDMSVPYKEFPGLDTDFAQVRDSLYLLTIMNQYTMKAKESQKREAEGLLRIVLFSKDLRLRDTGKTLKKLRQEIAHELRESRRGGAVPAFIGQFWFMFAMVVSIQQAFWAVGDNATAHNLSLGLVLSWLPVLILCSIVDQAPGNPDGARRRLNELIDETRYALQDEHTKQDFVALFRDRPGGHRMEAWVNRIAVQSEFMDGFFVDFAGQGRLRFHYGASHAILADIEKSYIGLRGRDWLCDEHEARLNLVLGPVDADGLVWFDLQELWQVFHALTLFCTTVLGSFMLSYYTPTIGLGCHTGGYLIFAIIAIFLLLAEAIIWWLCTPIKAIADKPQHAVAHQAHQLVTRLADCLERGAVKIAFTLLEFRYRDNELSACKWSVADRFRQWRRLPAWTLWERLFFRPIEGINCVWLIYICASQTFGAYETCDCMSSTWSSLGGYMDFNNYNEASGSEVIKYWIAGTIIGCASMCFGLFYIIQEWCKQSFMVTTDYHNALAGLRARRLYMRVTYPFRQLSRFATALVVMQWAVLCRLTGRRVPMRTTTLVWTKTSGPSYGKEIEVICAGEPGSYVDIHEKTSSEDRVEAKDSVVTRKAGKEEPEEVKD